MWSTAMPPLVILSNITLKVSLSPPLQNNRWTLHIYVKYVVLQNHLTHICAETTCSDQNVPIKGYLEQNLLLMKNCFQVT